MLFSSQFLKYPAPLSVNDLEIKKEEGNFWIGNGGKENKEKRLKERILIRNNQRLKERGGEGRE